MPPRKLYFLLQVYLYQNFTIGKTLFQLIFLEKPDLFVSYDFLSFSTLKNPNSQTTLVFWAKSVEKILKIIF